MTADRCEGTTSERSRTYRRYGTEPRCRNTALAGGTLCYRHQLAVERNLRAFHNVWLSESDVARIMEMPPR